MKIAAIAKVIKDRGSCRLYRVHGSDDLETKFYIGTNSEIYSLEGFPKPWSEAEVMTMLGIEKKKWEDVIYTAYDCNAITDVCGLNLEDAVQNEVECKTSYINSVTACLLADMGRQNITSDQADTFKKTLAKRMAEYAESGRFSHFSIMSDYGPCGMLADAANEAGISAANFPFKTTMFLTEKDGIIVRNGYGAPAVKLWG